MANTWQGGALMQNIFDDVRDQISDDADLYTDRFLLSAINSALKLIGLAEDAQRIFKYKLQTELATVNADGTPAARWTLNIPGKYNGQEYMNFVKQDDCYTCLTPCFKPNKEFHKCCRFPENECPGDPCSYTLEHIGQETTLIFDRPPADLVAVDAVLYIIPRRLTLSDKTIPLADAYSELLTEMIKIIINKEQTSFDQARMRYEDFDALIVDVVQRMALIEMGDKILVVNGGLD